MSRAYRVRWVTVNTTVTSESTTKLQLSLLGILPEDEMLALVRDELTRDGWKAAQDGTLTHEPSSDVRATLSADGKEVTLSHAAAVQAEGRGVNDAQAQASADVAAARARAGLDRKAGRRMLEIEPDVRAKLGEAVQRAYVEALKRKAASLGQIVSIEEGRRADGEREVTIKVKT